MECRYRVVVVHQGAWLFGCASVVVGPLPLGGWPSPPPPTHSYGRPRRRPPTAVRRGRADINNSAQTSRARARWQFGTHGGARGPACLATATVGGRPIRQRRTKGPEGGPVVLSEPFAFAP